MRIGESHFYRLYSWTIATDIPCKFRLHRYVGAKYVNILELMVRSLHVTPHWLRFTLIPTVLYGICAVNRSELAASYLISYAADVRPSRAIFLFYFQCHFDLVLVPQILYNCTCGSSICHSTIALVCSRCIFQNASLLR